MATQGSASAGPGQNPAYRPTHRFNVNLSMAKAPSRPPRAQKRHKNFHQLPTTKLSDYRRVMTEGQAEEAAAVEPASEKHQEVDPFAEKMKRIERLTGIRRAFQFIPWTLAALFGLFWLFDVGDGPLDADRIGPVADWVAAIAAIAAVLRYWWNSMGEQRVKLIDELFADKRLSLIHISEPTRPY